MIRIDQIEPGSIAEELELQVGTRIVRVNGERVRDGIDFTFLVADAELELEAVEPNGQRTILDIVQDPDEELGIVPAPDTVRECANECVFCFIDGNPEGARQSLSLRDDDFRLSFTYGSYVTLTNLGPKGLQRLVDQRLSPLYVSVHATEPDVRVRLLKNRRAGLIMDQLRFLTDHGLEVHTQIVLCPEWNDGPHLDRTIRDLYSLGPGVRTLSVVPVGLTRFNVNRPVRPLTKPESVRALEQVEAIRERAARERGYHWCYAADELFLLTDRDPPPGSYYDDFSLTENGVGAVRTFLDAFDEGLGDLPDLGDRRIRLLTGRSMAPFLEERAAVLAEATGAEVDVTMVRNQYFGDLVTVGGLLSGRDLLGAATYPQAGDLILIPAEALNQDEVFIDSLPLDTLRRELAPAQVLPAFEITEALRSL